MIEIKNKYSSFPSEIIDELGTEEERKYIRSVFLLLSSLTLDNIVPSEELDRKKYIRIVDKNNIPRSLYSYELNFAEITNDSKEYFSECFFSMRTTENDVITSIDDSVFLSFIHEMLKKSDLNPSIFVSHQNPFIFYSKKKDTMNKSETILTLEKIGFREIRELSPLMLDRDVVSAIIKNLSKPLNKIDTIITKKYTNAHLTSTNNHNEKKLMLLKGEEEKREETIEIVSNQIVLITDNSDDDYNSLF